MCPIIKLVIKFQDKVYKTICCKLYIQVKCFNYRGPYKSTHVCSDNLPMQGHIFCPGPASFAHVTLRWSRLFGDRWWLWHPKSWRQVLQLIRYTSPCFKFSVVLSAPTGDRVTTVDFRSLPLHHHCPCHVLLHKIRSRQPVLHLVLALQYADEFNLNWGSWF